MFFRSSNKHKSFQYTPLTVKEPPKDLRERMRVPRHPDRHKPGRSVLYWVLLIAAVLMLFQYLFPGSIQRLFHEDVQIEFGDHLKALAPVAPVQEESP
jgi:hypothetical protein